jgi:hypothetical protein
VVAIRPELGVDQGITSAPAITPAAACGPAGTIGCVIARVLACLVAACVAMLVPAGAAVAAGAHAQFRLSDSRLDEVSGIAAGIASPGVVYVQNDGGDAARFFALDARTGMVRAVYTVPGARNVDWEDIAVAPDSRGTPSVWLADIGDNDAERTQVELYRVDEPHVNMAGSGVATRSGRPDVWRLTYPDGPHDAESLAVSPGGVPYLVTKSLVGSSKVYAARPAPGRSVLRRVGAIRFHTTGTRGPFAPLGQLLATGADISRDGRLFVVRTYTDAYLWGMAGGDLSSALQRPPVRLALPYQPQGEGICVSGDHLLVDSEGVRSAVYAVGLPAHALPPADPAPSPRPAPAPPSASAAPDAPDGGATWGWWAGGASAAALILLILGAIRGARRRPRN